MMNTQSDAISKSFEAHTVASAVMSPTKPFYWSVRRELWENRFVYIAPAALASVYLLGFLSTTIFLPAKIRSLEALYPERYREGVAVPYDIAAGLMMLTGILVSVFYCLDALHGERRDRSILFWKSLPVSDLTTVLAKASIPLLIVPLITFAITLGMHWIMLLLSSAVLVANGLSVATLWTRLSIAEMWLQLLYHLVTAHVLWVAPFYCWLLLVSAWARRATFLWAVLPVVAVAGLEKLTFRTSHFAAMVISRVLGSAPGIHTAATNAFPTGPMTHLMPGAFLSSPGLWIGLVVAAGFLALAAALRRKQVPI
jgi:ABC-2 type transport system permease protein